VLPARPYKPRDKAKVEGTVLIVQRWILAKIRNEVFNSLAALNARIAELLIDLNARVMRRYGKSRRELFESTERAALLALPSSRFEYAEWKKATVNIDYHVLFETHSYSVPYAYVHEEVWVRTTSTVVEVLLRNRRIALHARSWVRGGFTTLTAHMPSWHRAQAEWTPSRILAWAEETGPAVRAYCAVVLEQRRHPEHGFKSCLGILRLGKRYGRERLNAACARAHHAGSRTYRSVESILDKGLDRLPEQTESADVAPIPHDNVRGPDYYLDSTEPN
jgi:transposase